MAYIQDDWRPFSKLTVNAGLRYEFFSPNFEQNNHILNYDPANSRILHAGTGTDTNTIGSGGSSSYTIHYVGGSGLPSSPCSESPKTSEQTQQNALRPSWRALFLAPN